MRKLFLIMTVIFILFCGGVYYLYTSLWGPGVNNTSDYEMFIPTGASYEDVNNHLLGEQIIKNSFLFDVLAGQMNYKKDQVKSGRFIIKPNTSIRDLISKLRSGNQDPIDITFNNIRTVDELAGRVGRQIEPDSLSLLNVLLSEQNVEGLGLTEESVATLYIPNTYQVYWDMTPQEFVDRMIKEHEKFWSSKNRKEKASELGFTPQEVTILASILQKESNLRSEQPIIAGLYLNRIKLGMPLQADPTVVFAIGDFTIQRVLNKQLLFESPYNTYLNQGLPPGPICIPESTAIDAVLNADDHKYLYMCAKPGYNEEHLFANDLVDHNKNARIYHRWLSREGIMR